MKYILKLFLLIIVVINLAACSSVSSSQSEDIIFPLILEARYSTENSQVILNWSSETKSDVSYFDIYRKRPSDEEIFKKINTQSVSANITEYKINYYSYSHVSHEFFIARFDKQLKLLDTSNNVSINFRSIIPLDESLIPSKNNVPLEPTPIVVTQNIVPTMNTPQLPTQNFIPTMNIPQLPTLNFLPTMNIPQLPTLNFLPTMNIPASYQQ